MSNNMDKKELLTQQEVAEYFRVVPATIKNWRDRGLLSYWQAPGSTRVLYYRDEVLKFRDENTISKKGGDRKRKSERVKVNPVVLTKRKTVWRI